MPTTTITAAAAENNNYDERNITQKAALLKI